MKPSTSLTGTSRCANDALRKPLPPYKTNQTVGQISRGTRRDLTVEDQHDIHQYPCMKPSTSLTGTSRCANNALRKPLPPYKTNQTVGQISRGTRRDLTVEDQRDIHQCPRMKPSTSLTGTSRCANDALRKPLPPYKTNQTVGQISRGTRRDLTVEDQHDIHQYPCMKPSTSLTGTSRCANNALRKPLPPYKTNQTVGQISRGTRRDLTVEDQRDVHQYPRVRNHQRH
jgi:hypothetical protein